MPPRRNYRNSNNANAAGVPGVVVVLVVLVALRVKSSGCHILALACALHAPACAACYCYVVFLGIMFTIHETLVGGGGERQGPRGITTATFFLFFVFHVIPLPLQPLKYKY
jgi:hypothetical protein